MTTENTMQTLLFQMAAAANTLTESMLIDGDDPDEEEVIPARPPAEVQKELLELCKQAHSLWIRNPPVADPEDWRRARVEILDRLDDTVQIRAQIKVGDRVLMKTVRFSQAHGNSPINAFALNGMTVKMEELLKDLVWQLAGGK